MKNKNSDPNFKSALKVNDGIEQPPSINSDAAERFKKVKRETLSVDDYVNGIRTANRTILSKAITLVESSLQEHEALAQEIIVKCLPLAKKSVRIGITGVPGAGKSTFIEAFGKHLTETGHKVAVLAIDPSSSRTKGSILGDKTRMENLSVDANAFIRPSPSSGSLGGVARKTRESIILCEAAGFDVIIVETVGVGQSETLVHSMVDFFLLIMLTGAGDELQGIKRGIMEMADGIAINKADGDNIHRASLTKAELKNALHYFPLAESKWETQVNTCSALTHSGIADVWQMVLDYVDFTKKNQYFEQRRLEQSRQIMIQTLEQSILDRFYQDKRMKKLLQQTEKKLMNQELSAYQAAEQLLNAYFE